jgi:hypothetical protein
MTAIRSPSPKWLTSPSPHAVPQGHLDRPSFILLSVGTKPTAITADPGNTGAAWTTVISSGSSPAPTTAACRAATIYTITQTATLNGLDPEA